MQKPVSISISEFCVYLFYVTEVFPTQRFVKVRSALCCGNTETWRNTEESSPKHGTIYKVVFSKQSVIIMIIIILKYFRLQF